VPFWAKGKQAPRLRAAKARRTAAQATLNEAMREASAQYQHSKASHKATLQAITILEQKIIAVNDEISAQQARYESGTGDYASIIDGEIVILKLQAEIAAEESRRAIALAQMNALLVTP
jgi:outer membrane protein TolC